MKRLSVAESKLLQKLAIVPISIFMLMAMTIQPAQAADESVQEDMSWIDRWEQMLDNFFEDLIDIFDEEYYDEEDFEDELDDEYYEDDYENLEEDSDEEDFDSEGEYDSMEDDSEEDEEE